LSSKIVCPTNFGPSTTCTKYDTDIYQHIVGISKPYVVLSYRSWYTSNLQLYKFEIMGFDKFRSKFGTSKQKYRKIAIIFKCIEKLRHNPICTSRLGDTVWIGHRIDLDHARGPRH
jgi:hypothetical protein